jgi:hypothetical protein
MWFMISILAERKTLKLFRVSPCTADSPEIWNGFGNATTESLEQSYLQRVELETKDIALGCHLWVAYKAHKLDLLKELSFQKSKCFSNLEEVCQAHIDRFGDPSTLSRPDRVVKEIIQDGHIDFESVMTEFSKREGIYGLGDLQLKKIYDKQMMKNLNQ